MSSYYVNFFLIKKANPNTYTQAAASSTVYDNTNNYLLYCTV